MTGMLKIDTKYFNLIPTTALREGLGIAIVAMDLLFGHSVMSNSATLWTVAHQAPLSKVFSRQEY